MENAGQSKRRPAVTRYRSQTRLPVKEVQPGRIIPKRLSSSQTPEAITTCGQCPLQAAYLCGWAVCQESGITARGFRITANMLPGAAIRCPEINLETFQPAFSQASRIQYKGSGGEPPPPLPDPPRICIQRSQEPQNTSLKITVSTPFNSLTKAQFNANICALVNSSSK